MAASRSCKSRISSPPTTRWVSIEKRLMTSEKEAEILEEESENVINELMILQNKAVVQCSSGGPARPGPGGSQHLRLASPRPDCCFCSHDFDAAAPPHPGRDVTRADS
mmetsp:Transcript_33287/g.84752  ORF Transcript_33287/g.84752 Transcript_33287/m.84752 type:complete len:108 (-) Transcript_33287:63-386(-)